MHVLAIEGALGGDRDRLLARAFHVEAGLSLALRAVHAVVEDAHRDHVAEHLAQRLGIELWIPRSDGLIVIIEYSDELCGQRMSLASRRSNVRTRSSSCGRN